MKGRCLSLLRIWVCNRCALAGVPMDVESVPSLSISRLRAFQCSFSSFSSALLIILPSLPFNFPLYTCLHMFCMFCLCILISLIKYNIEEWNTVVEWRVQKFTVFGKHFVFRIPRSSLFLPCGLISLDKKENLAWEWPCQGFYHPVAPTSGIGWLKQKYIYLNRGNYDQVKFRYLTS